MGGKKKTNLELARLALGKLTLDELKQLRKELPQLIQAQQHGGGLFGGGGRLEYKFVRGHGPYLYYRRWVTDEQGKRRLVNAGYYGKAQLDADQLKHLLEIHRTQGQSAGLDYLNEVGALGDEINPWKKKAPTQLREHPFGPGFKIEAWEIRDNPVFLWLKQQLPEEADYLMWDLHEWGEEKHKKEAYDRFKNYAAEHGVTPDFFMVLPQFYPSSPVHPTEEIARRAWYLRQREKPQPVYRIGRRKRK